MKIQNVYICCTPLISPTLADKNIIMHQLKSFKQYKYYRNDQLDGMNNIYENNNVFSIPLLSLRSNETTIWIR